MTNGEAKTEGTAAAAPPQDDAEGYWDLVSTNANFRRLWFGNVISLLGDWFNTIALYVLVSELTGSPLALGVVFLCKNLPWAVVSPVAGILVDRLDRRRVMLASDLGRALVVLGFLAIDEPSEAPFLYGLIILQVVLGAVFHPAQSAVLPNITAPRQLLTANTLMSATWSMMLALGAALGGLATHAVGTRAVFVMDSLTYLVSAFFIFRLTLPGRSRGTDPVESGPVLRTALQGILEGWRHLWQEARVGRMALVKPAWSLGGGALIYMLALLGAEVAPQAEAVGIGLLLTVRGIATGLGPVLCRSWFKNQRQWPKLLAICIAATGVSYALVSSVPWSYAVAVLVFLGHLAGGSQWVLSSVILQQRTEDRFRGRVFATEWLLVTLADSASIVAASLLLESAVLELRMGFRLFGLLQVAAAGLWALLAVPREGGWRLDRDS